MKSSTCIARQPTTIEKKNIKKKISIDGIILTWHQLFQATCSGTCYQEPVRKLAVK